MLVQSILLEWMCEVLLFSVLSLYYLKPFFENGNGVDDSTLTAGELSYLLLVLGKNLLQRAKIKVLEILHQ